MPVDLSKPKTDVGLSGQERSIREQVRPVLDDILYSNIIEPPSSAYTLTADQNGKTILCRSTCNIVVNTTLPVGFTCLVVQIGPGPTTFSTETGVTFRQPASTSAPPRVLESGGVVSLLVLGTSEVLFYGALI